MVRCKRKNDSYLTASSTRLPFYCASYAVET